MLRDEAMERAIACAEVDMKYGMPADLLVAKARLGELWLGIADRLPVREEPEPDASPTGPRWPRTVLAEVQEEDGDPTMALCGHRITSLLHRGRWLHSYSLDVCDDPPVKRAER